MKIHRTILTLLLLLALSFVALGDAGAVAAAQQDSAAIATDDGLLFVWNARGLYFTLLLRGKEVKPFNDTEHIFFTVDGRVLQIQLASIANFAPDAREKKFDERSILSAHRDWESKFIGELLKSELNVKTFNAKLSNGRAAMVWQFDMPEAVNVEVKKQVYLTVVQNDYVLLLNTEAMASAADSEARKFLLDTIATLKLSAEPIDVKKLADSIRAGGKP